MDDDARHPVFQTDTRRWPLISWIAAWTVYLGGIGLIILAVWVGGKLLTGLLNYLLGLG